MKGDTREKEREREKDVLTKLSIMFSSYSHE